MAVTSKVYAKGLLSFVGASINFASDTIKVALATSSYTPNQSTHDFFDDVTNEVTGTGYTAGGATLASKTAATSSLVLTLDAADPSWATSTITARYAIVYKSTGTASTSPLISYIDFGADVVSTGGTFTITLDALGLVTITAA